MTPARWKRLRAAIEAALDAPSEDRDRVLAMACADEPMLLSEARSIIRVAEDTPWILEESPESDDSTDPVEKRHQILDHASIPSIACSFPGVARAMRRALVDAARRQERINRGSHAGLGRSGSEGALDEFTRALIDLDDALTRLTALFPRQAQVAEFRFFGGLSIEEIGDVLRLASATVKSDWALARAWLFRELREPELR